ncbi:Use1 [Kluyveromyces lactis]|nr:Use1 [Kluyveromyces lactis]
MNTDLDTLSDQLRKNYYRDLSLFQDDEDPFYHYLISTKLATNLNTVRKLAIKNNLDDPSSDAVDRYQKNFSRLEESVGSISFSKASKLQQKYDAYQESQKKRRYSVDFDATPDVPIGDEVDVDIISNVEVINDNDSLKELRQRLMGKRRGSADTEGESFDKQMQIQDDLQKELVEDMSQLVSGLRQGAEAFQNAIEHDSTVLKAAEIGLHVTSKSLSSLGSRLKKYHNEKIGFFMKLGLLSFIIIGLLVTYLVIKVFPDL